MTKLKQLFPECVLFDIEEVEITCSKLNEMDMTRELDLDKTIPKLY